METQQGVSTFLQVPVSSQAPLLSAVQMSSAQGARPRELTRDAKEKQGYGCPVSGKLAPAPVSVTTSCFSEGACWL